VNAIFVLLVLMGGGFLLVGGVDLLRWAIQRNELKSVNRWNKFRTISEENTRERK
jgi:hypothetical protein